MKIRSFLLVSFILLSADCASSPDQRLLRSADSGDREGVKASLSSGANLLAREPKYGNTALHLAAYRGDLEIVRELVSRGLDPNTQANDGITPLIAACRKGHLDVAKFLVSQGADVNLQDQYGITPLMAAAYSDHLELVEFLLSSKAKTKITNKNGKTALDKARSEKVRNLIQQYARRER